MTINYLEKAISVALLAHEGTETLSGRPYILHPLRLMLEMGSEEDMITAMLHDVVEDSDISIEELAGMGFSDQVLGALGLLTHDNEKSSYEDYILAIMSNPMATRVKLADLTHNMDIRRLPAPLTEGDLERLQKYRRAWETLTSQS